jgi:hypothetical protein
MIVAQCAESVVLPYLPAFSVTPTQLEVGPDGAQLKISGKRFLSAILHVLRCSCCHFALLDQDPIRIHYTGKKIKVNGPFFIAVTPTSILLAKKRSGRGRVPVTLLQRDFFTRFCLIFHESSSSGLLFIPSALFQIFEHFFRYSDVVDRIRIGVPHENLPKLTNNPEFLLLSGA